MTTAVIKGLSGDNVYTKGKRVALFARRKERAYPSVCKRRATQQTGMNRQPDCIGYSLTGPNGRQVAYKGQGGFTLLEVALSVLVLSISILAVGAGEIASLKKNTSGEQFTLMAAAGEEMLERMRRNRTEVSPYTSFDTLPKSTNIIPTLEPAGPVPEQNDIDPNTGQQFTLDAWNAAVVVWEDKVEDIMQANDLRDWEAQVEEVGGACGTVDVVPNTPIPSVNMATITLNWPTCVAPVFTTVLQTAFRQ